MDRFLLNDVKYMQDLLVPQGEGTRYVLRPTLPAMQELCASWNVSTQICSELCDYANAVRSHRSRAHGKADIVKQQVQAQVAYHNLSADLQHAVHTALSTLQAFRVHHRHSRTEQQLYDHGLTFRQLMACKSAFPYGQSQTNTYPESTTSGKNIVKLGSDRFSYTAIVTFYRRVDVVPRMLRALTEQSVPPREIWATWWNSPVHDEIAQAVTDFQAQQQHEGQAIPIRWLSGDVNLKYYGRFQAALQVSTPYTALLDDDTIPGRYFFEACLHTINIIPTTAVHSGSTGADNPQCPGYRGLLGVKAGNSPLPLTRWQMREELPYRRMPFYGHHPFTFGPQSGRHNRRIVRTDCVGGGWFLEAAWVKLMFRERPYTWQTAEDFSLSYALKKFAGLHTYVMPVEASDARTWGYQADYLAVSAAGDSTDRRMNLLRDRLNFHLFQRGWARAMGEGVEPGRFLTTDDAARVGSVIAASFEGPIPADPAARAKAAKDMDASYHDVYVHAGNDNAKALNVIAFADSPGQAHRLRQLIDHIGKGSRNGDVDSSIRTQRIHGTKVNGTGPPQMPKFLWQYVVTGRAAHPKATVIDAFGREAAELAALSTDTAAGGNGLYREEKYTGVYDLMVDADLALHPTRSDAGGDTGEGGGVTADVGAAAATVYGASAASMTNPAATNGTATTAASVAVSGASSAVGNAATRMAATLVAMQQVLDALQPVLVVVSGGCKIGKSSNGLDNHYSTNSSSNARESVVGTGGDGDDDETIHHALAAALACTLAGVPVIHFSCNASHQSENTTANGQFSSSSSSSSSSSIDPTHTSPPLSPADLALQQLASASTSDAAFAADVAKLLIIGGANPAMLLQAPGNISHASSHSVLKPASHASMMKDTQSVSCTAQCRDTAAQDTAAPAEGDIDDDHIAFQIAYVRIFKTDFAWSDEAAVDARGLESRPIRPHQATITGICAHEAVLAGPHWDCAADVEQQLQRHVFVQGNDGSMSVIGSSGSSSGNHGQQGVVARGSRLRMLFKLRGHIVARVRLRGGTRAMSSAHAKHFSQYLWDRAVVVNCMIDRSVSSSGSSTSSTRSISSMSNISSWRSNDNSRSRPAGENMGMGEHLPQSGVDQHERERGLGVHFLPETTTSCFAAADMGHTEWCEYADLLFDASTGAVVHVARVRSRARDSATATATATDSESTEMSFLLESVPSDKVAGRGVGNWQHLSSAERPGSSSGGSKVGGASLRFSQPSVQRLPFRSFMRAKVLWLPESTGFDSNTSSCISNDSGFAAADTLVPRIPGSTLVMAFDFFGGNPFHWAEKVLVSFYRLWYCSKASSALAASGQGLCAGIGGSGASGSANAGYDRVLLLRHPHDVSDWQAGLLKHAIATVTTTEVYAHEKHDGSVRTNQIPSAILWMPPYGRTPTDCAGCPGWPSDTTDESSSSNSGSGGYGISSQLDAAISFEHAVILGTSLTFLPGPEPAIAFRRRVWSTVGVARATGGASRPQQPRVIQVTYIQRHRSRRVLNDVHIISTLRAWARQRSQKQHRHQKQQQEQAHQNDDDQLTQRELQVVVEVVQLETLSFHSQVRLMSRTTILVGVHGAGLSNCIFLPEGSAVVELHPARLVYPLYEKIASAAGHFHFRYLASEHETEFWDTVAAARYRGWSTRMCFGEPGGKCIRVSKDVDIRVDANKLIAVLDDVVSVVG